ncbi:HAMP domain-containing histidine kinase [Paenibacillus lycopersici]|uniref:Heme sensor protein HssS n=1 Tax=Paenibacillus lycopersici TaxID=2704462 RepID=A0A6C0G3R4_9BACL|nr:HAMP domain-containing sensor histidine kinase [Paenibacillus lycopersici]QHT59415.1 HAMP domain-containing histidine kinase [Paenibacillus lycopersici]
MRSLYFRVFLMTMAVILASSVIGFLISNAYYHAKLKPYNDEKLVGIGEQMKRFIEADPGGMDRYLRNAAALGYQIYVTDGLGDAHFYGRSFRELDLKKPEIELVLHGGTYHGVKRFPNKLFISGFFDNRLSNTIGLPVQGGAKTYAMYVRPDVLLQFGELRVFFALIGLLTVIVSILFFIFSTRYLVKPITRLTDATKRIAQGNYNLRLPAGRRDEIGRLAEHFMAMSKELERVDQARQQFVSNVSHEIQSPLTSIQGFAHVLAQEELTKDERGHYAAIIEAESRHLAMLSKQLLLLSALEQGEEPLNKRPFSFRDHIKQVIYVLQWQLEEKELLLKLSVPESVTIYGDEVLLTQVWMNVLGNAIQHIQAGRSIEIRAEQRDSRSVIVIADTGDGIAPEHLPFLFDRFYRVDRARERSSGRAGLGLAIVKKIVLLHGGSIEASSVPGEGTRFTVTLPQL